MALLPAPTLMVPELKMLALPLMPAPLAPTMTVPVLATAAVASFGDLVKGVEDKITEFKTADEAYTAAGKKEKKAAKAERAKALTAHQAAVIAGEIDRLEELREPGLILEDELSRMRAKRGVGVVDGELALAIRYRRAAERELAATWDALRQRQAESAAAAKAVAVATGPNGL